MNATKPVLILILTVIAIAGCNLVSPDTPSCPQIYLTTSGTKEIRFGYTDRFGKMIIPLKYEEARQFSAGLAAVKLNRKWGFIDARDSIIIPLTYGWASSFDEYGFDGLAIVKINNNTERLGIMSLGKTGLINNKGDVILPLSYVFISPVVNGLALVNNGTDQNNGTGEYDGKFGFINKKGRIIIPCIYDQAEPFLHATSIVKKNGKWGALNPKGKEIIPCAFDTLYREASEQGIITGKQGPHTIQMKENGARIKYVRTY